MKKDEVVSSWNDWQNSLSLVSVKEGKNVDGTCVEK